jgi:hypothetical protein
MEDFLTMFPAQKTADFLETHTKYNSYDFSISLNKIKNYSAKSDGN